MDGLDADQVHLDDLLEGLAEGVESCTDRCECGSRDVEQIEDQPQARTTTQSGEADRPGRRKCPI